MKQITKRFFISMAVFFLAAFAGITSGCSDDFYTPAYRLQAPAIPEAWSALWGEASWHFIWINPQGKVMQANSAKSSYEGAVILQDCANPVLAYPYWPQHPIEAGIMKPAGAIFPLDCKKGEVIALSFSGGVDASLYHEMTLNPNGKRQAAFFDWARFRALWNGKSLPEEIRKDPWLADWKAFAEKTSASGFSAKRIKPRVTENLIISLPSEGPWIAASPFASILTAEEGKKTALLVSDAVDTYFCPEGFLRVTRHVSIWHPYKKTEVETPSVPSE